VLPVRFDDRLLTVLNQPTGNLHDVAVRWRQLVDLVARAGSMGATPIIGDALERIRAEAGMVDEPLRAATARAVAALPLPLGLLEIFAADTLAVSAPVLAAATLDRGQWRSLLAVADSETAKFIETLHPDVSGEEPSDFTDTLVEAEPGLPEPSPPAAASPPSLSEVVARIERRRRSRAALSGAAGAATGTTAPALFRWECGPGGDIDWVEGAPRGALVGRSLARPRGAAGEGVSSEAARAFAVRAPFRDALLHIGGDGQVAGEWKISGVPAFDPGDGRFAGYRGVALRDSDGGAAQEPELGDGNLLPDPDSLRELVHEIKTPLNAIIGFAEIIDGQYLGPADRRYRQRAGTIVGEARLLLAAIDDLDFVAKIHSSAAGSDQRTDIGQLVEQLAPSIRELASPRKVEIEASRTTGELAARISPELADRVIFKMAAAIVEQAAAGERLRIAADGRADRVQVSLGRPKALQGLSAEQMFAPPAAAKLGAGAEFAAGFALRLARGLARIAGVEVSVDKTAIALVFPRA
jgi:hypothetical protein